ncbi:MAG TPA: gamma-glutamyltransferase family protein [Candidatus Binataceae bacterium]|nr:gamma-glutamyltransferase family protein [Candidatus Binataceae bacterium]
MNTLCPLVMGRHVMIATEHYLSAAAGARMFARGGNAIDAAVAAAFVEGVVNPHMHTIGGEAPMLIYSAEANRVVSINGNTMAPARATIAFYKSRNIDLIPGEGLLAAGVPAALDALVTALAHFGSLTLADVVEPALALCADGFPMHAGLSGEGSTWTGMRGTAGAGSIKANAQNFRERWPSSAKLYLSNGQRPDVGTIIKNPALAHFFRRLLDSEAGARNRGRVAALEAARDRFYRGDIADEIVAWSDANGGLLAAQDLRDFVTKLEEPASVDYRGVTVFKCGPWSQGPVFLQQLRLLEGFDLRAAGHNSAAYIHLVVESLKLAFADREAYYGDPDFVRVPMEALLSPEYSSIRRKLIDPKHASLEQRPGDPIGMKPLAASRPEARSWGSGTVHVTAADRRGNMIAITPSGAWISSSPVVEGLGFPLGSRLQTFYLDERHPNAVMPRKRPRTTLTPSLALRNGEPYIAFGTPGGDQQDQWTFQFFLNVVDFGMNLQEAIEAPKFSSGHFPSTFFPHDNTPGLLRIEDRVDASVRSALADLGHKIETKPSYSEGNVLAVQVDRAHGLLCGGADPRGQMTLVMPAQVIGW